MIKDNTIHALNLFDINTKDMYILHIPHSSTYLPSFYNYEENVVNDEINKLTDWATDEIFNVEDVDKIVCDFSRVYCDVERFHDDNLEIMSEIGRGFYYTKTDNGITLRSENLDDKKFVYENYYLPHHTLLNNLVSNKLEKYNNVIIIDCHSFSDIPFNTDLIKDNNRPDICIGTDDFHTPKELENKIVDFFKRYNFLVGINNPYSGTMVNNNSYLIDKRVNSIMIEINRKLYMDNNVVNKEKVSYLNNIIKELLLYLY